MICPFAFGAGIEGALRSFPLSRVYQLLEPGPVVLLTTAHRSRANVMTMSWHMMVEFEPPLLACIVSEANFTFRTLRSTGEAAIAIPARGLADKVVKVGNCSGKDTDKSSRFGLTPVAARQVSPPLISECFCNLECRVTDTNLVKRYNLSSSRSLRRGSTPRRRTRRPAPPRIRRI
jgi:flavin reductase (DIM6/NTAB) family NADH-FMN oxidoreductase RutF